MFKKFAGKILKHKIVFFLLVLYLYTFIPLHLYKLDLGYASADERNEIAVTAVQISDSKGAITINDSLQINALLLVHDSSGKNYIQMPSYMDKDKKEIPYVTLLTDDAKSAVENAVYNNAIDKDTEKSISCKIAEITLYDEENNSLKALAMLVLNEAVAIEVRIIETDEKLWVMWPMKKDIETQKWVKLVEVTNNSMKKMIEKIVLKKYKNLI